VQSEITAAKRAPEPLDLVQRFVNSVDFEREEEDLASPEALREWLATFGLMSADEPVTDGDLRRALDVREGLRALLLEHTGEPLDSAAVERMNRAAGRAGMLVRADEHGHLALAPEASGVDGALGRLLGIVATAAADGSWDRLKACLHEGCLWAFYDRSKNRSGKWCTMESCGNVEKARAYRARRRDLATT